MITGSWQRRKEKRNKRGSRENVRSRWTWPLTDSVAGQKRSVASAENSEIKSARKTRRRRYDDQAIKVLLRQLLKKIESRRRLERLAHL